MVKNNLEKNENEGNVNEVNVLGARVQNGIEILLCNHCQKKFCKPFLMLNDGDCIHDFLHRKEQKATRDTVNFRFLYQNRIRHNIIVIEHPRQVVLLQK